MAVKFVLSPTMRATAPGARRGRGGRGRPGRGGQAVLVRVRERRAGPTPSGFLGSPDERSFRCDLGGGTLCRAVPVHEGFPHPDRAPKRCNLIWRRASRSMRSVCGLSWSAPSAAPMPTAPGDWKLAYEAGEVALVLFLREIRPRPAGPAGTPGALLPILTKVAGASAHAHKALGGDGALPAVLDALAHGAGGSGGSADHAARFGTEPSGRDRTSGDPRGDPGRRSLALERIGRNSRADLLRPRFRAVRHSF